MNQLFSKAFTFSNSLKQMALPGNSSVTDGACVVTLCLAVGSRERKVGRIARSYFPVF